MTTDDLIRIGAADEHGGYDVELRALDAFWQLQESMEHRPELLRLFARIVIARRPDWDCMEIRRAGCEIALFAEHCFCCGAASRRLYWHHVIQVQHGGSNTPRNMVHACHRCHAAVHPWLDPEREGEEVGGFRHISGADL